MSVLPNKETTKIAATMDWSEHSSKVSQIQTAEARCVITLAQYTHASFGEFPVTL